jgi:type IV secretory pathway VirB10-like protein
MSKRTHAFLSGAAALALIAGADMAAAQEPGEHGAPQATHAPAGNTESGAADTEQQNRIQSHAATPDAKSRAAAGQKPSSCAEPGKRAQDIAPKGDKTKPADSRAAEQRDHEHLHDSQNGTEQNKSEPNRNSATAQDQRQGAGAKETSQAPPANAGRAAHGGGGNVQLTAQQRTTIRDSVINGGDAPKLASVNFDVTVGTVVPRADVHVVPVPETLVEIDPQWRGFLYFVYREEVAIVDPDNMQIVAVVEA